MTLLQSMDTVPPSAMGSVHQTQHLLALLAAHQRPQHPMAQAQSEMNVVRRAPVNALSRSRSQQVRRCSEVSSIMQNTTISVETRDKLKSFIETRQRLKSLNQEGELETGAKLTTCEVRPPRHSGHDHSRP